MFVGLLFWFQFYCGFSASAMIDQWYLIFFNLLFSSLPQLVTGVLDKDVPADVLLAEPQLYRSGQNMEVSPGPRRPFRGHPGQTEQGRHAAQPAIVKQMSRHESRSSAGNSHADEPA